MKLLFEYIKKHKFIFMVMSILTIISTVASLLVPSFLSNIIDIGIAGQDIEEVKKNSLYMIIAALISIVAVIFATKLSTNFGTNFATDLRKRVFKKANELSLDNFHKIGADSMLTRTTENIFMIQMMSTQVVNAFFTVPILLLGGGVLAFSKSVMLSLILFAVSPIIVIIVVLVGKNLEKLWKQSQKWTDKQVSTAEERLTGIRVIRAFSKEGAEHKKLSSVIDVMAGVIIKANITNGVLVPVSMFLLDLSIVAIVFVGGLQVIAGNILSGDVVEVVQYVMLCINGILILSFMIIFLPQIQIISKRLYEVFNMETDNLQAGKDISEIKGKIEFKNVSFAYEEAESPAIENISFSVEQGETLTIIGGTGCGKSTIANVLIRFFNHTKGEILIDGHKIEDLPKYTLRKNLSYILQTAGIFSGTIRDNVAMGKEDVTEEEIVEALKIAQIYHFVEKNEKGLDHAIGEGGVNLSGGQKQRIAIARAIVKNSPVYIFDDSFSALDFLTESKLKESMNSKLGRRTQIVITQRVTSCIHADKVLVMDKGTVVGYGKHHHLLESCQLYKEIYLSQVGKDIKSEVK